MTLLEDKPWTGRCACGPVRFSATDMPRVQYCHCGMCRRASGGAFAVLRGFRKPSLTWGERPGFYRSSPLAERRFCTRCGTPFTLNYEGSSVIAIDKCVRCPKRARARLLLWHRGPSCVLDIGKGLPAQETKARFRESSCGGSADVHSCSQRLMRIRMKSCRNAASHFSRRCFHTFRLKREASTS